VDLIIGFSERPGSHESSDRADSSRSAEPADLESLKAESLGWLPLDTGAYLHISDDSAAEVVITGVPQAGSAVLLLL
jgi:hypothetical protein